MAQRVPDDLYVGVMEESSIRDAVNLAQGFLKEHPATSLVFVELEDTVLTSAEGVSVQPDRQLDYFNTFLAAQIFAGDRSLLSNSAKVQDLISVAGDVHHIFPREYLKKNGFNDRWQYNQVANYAYLDTGVNISIGMKAPNDYFSAAYKQCETGDIAVGTITEKTALTNNLAANCIPAGVENMTAADYPEFLRQRRVLMAKKIKEYYYSL